MVYPTGEQLDSASLNVIRKGYHILAKEVINSIYFIFPIFTHVIQVGAPTKTVNGVTEGDVTFPVEILKCLRLHDGNQVT